MSQGASFFLRKTAPFFRVFSSKLTKFSQIGSLGAFSDKICAHVASLGAFLGKICFHIRRLVRFQAKFALMLLALRIFGQKLRSCCFAWCVLGKIRAHFVSLGVFWAKIILMLHRPTRFVANLQFASQASPCLRVFVCSHCSHFCRIAAKSTKTRGAFVFNLNNS